MSDRLTILLASLVLLSCGPGLTAAPTGEFIGSASCRECHERFYELWAPSHHGLAMQPFTAELARTRLTAHVGSLVIGETAYRFVRTDGGAQVVEQGPGERKAHPVTYALGGKNVYYFLTSLERGRLQVLPLAYDAREGEWFDTAASAMRHFADVDEEPVDWREWPYTFNTACFGCHVSQLEPNYDVATDAYRTTWGEPGINCETCHGGAAEHVRVCRESPEGKPPADLEIILTRDFTVEQTNSLCGSCHSKRMLLTASYDPGERFFDHFDVVALEHPDFYPDGRDLGENYTQTSWLMSPCAASGELDCRHCHTSSGRFRQKDDPNRSCLPCHDARVADPTPHTRHAADGVGSRCISCHMPKTWFARMQRHDHSMRPPAPAATKAFDSPNACNLCHRDRDAGWADVAVREWHERDYQAPVLRSGGLIKAARKQDWKRLPEMLAYLTGPERDDVRAVSLIRLLRRCEDPAKWPALLVSLDASSPWVRAAAAEALGDGLTAEILPALVEAARDEYRLVRVRAAAALAPVPARMFDEETRKTVTRATDEYVASMSARPDDATSHYNLGNYYFGRGEAGKAVDAYETAIRQRPDFIAPRVNIAHAYSATGRNDEAESSLRQAIELQPKEASAHFNLGLVLGEQGRNEEARAALRAALEADPTLAAAAFNLGILMAEKDLDEAVRWCGKAAELRPDEARYSYTAAFYRHENGDVAGAVQILQALIDRVPQHVDSWMLLGAIYEESGESEKARALFRAALEREEIPPAAKYGFAARLRSISE